MSITEGSTGNARRVVTGEMTATALGSGDVEVFGTPALLALMEQAAVDAVAGSIDEGRTSVGTNVTLEHLAPSRVGSEVHAVARVTSAEGRRITFEIEAFDGETLIGRATHGRAIVERARFS